MTTLVPLPLAVLGRTAARCWRATCGAAIAPVGQLRRSRIPVARFSGEWQQHEGVWRISSYAKVVRRRTAEGTVSLARRQRWTNPAAWKPVLAPLPCVVECPECGERQSIALLGLQRRRDRIIAQPASSARVSA